MEDWKLTFRIIRILSLIRPSPNSTFNCHKPRRIKLLSQLILGLSNFTEHKFILCFQDFLKYSAAVEKVKLKLSVSICFNVPTIRRNDWIDPREHNQSSVNYAFLYIIWNLEINHIWKYSWFWHWKKLPLQPLAAL